MIKMVGLHWINIIWSNVFETYSIKKKHLKKKKKTFVHRTNTKKFDLNTIG